MPMNLRPPGTPIKWIVIHHYGGWPPATRDALLHESLADGFADVPYSAYVAPDGSLIPGRGEQYVCAANLGINMNALAICLGGNFDADDNPHGEKGLPMVPSDSQLVAAASQIAEWVKKYPEAKVILHRDVQKLVPHAEDANGNWVSTATVCPGSRFVDGKYAEIIWKVVCGYSLEKAKQMVAAS